MLYTNEEPLVQKSCIKTANLQHDNYQSETLETQALPSHSLLSKANESRESIPEELKLQTLVCGHQVLSSLSDKSLVSICQKPNMRNFVMMRHKSSFVAGIDRSSCTIRIAWETASSART